MRIKEKALNGGNRSGFKQNHQFAGGKYNDFSVWNYVRKTFHGQRCFECKTDDLKHAVENNSRVFCRRCEQKIEFIRREKPHILAAAQMRAIA